MATRILTRTRAFAKINVTLRVLGKRRDGFHDLRTVFQSIALHDTLVFEHARGPFRIVCSDPNCPGDERNLVWRAADALARHARRPKLMHDLRVRITKRIPLESGLGGGSSDAAAALRALAALWRLRLAPEALREVAASLGADVSYFLEGGTALGVGRGDLLFRLIDLPFMWVVIVVPPFGVSTKEAYAWWHRPGGRAVGRRRSRGPERPARRFDAIPNQELRNDLEPPVVAKHPEIARIVAMLRRAGAEHASMSGSGSAVFGLFRSRTVAAAAATGCGRPDRRVVLTRTLGATEYALRANSWQVQQLPPRQPIV